MKKYLVKISFIVTLMSWQNASALKYTCFDLLSDRDKIIFTKSEGYIEKSVIPSLPHGDNIYKKLQEAKRTGVIACIAMKFTINNILKPTNIKILNKTYNLSIGRKTVNALKRYKFNKNSKNKNAIVIMQFEIEPDQIENK